MQWTERELLELVGQPTFDRGVGYWSQGRVTDLVTAPDLVTARVEGSEPYHVELTTTQWVCDCPMGSRGDLCKHCVAVALAASGEPVAASYAEKSPKSQAGRTTVEQWLAGLDREHLLELVLQATKDETFLRSLMLAAAKDTGDLQPLRDEIRKALRTRRRFLDWRESSEYGVLARQFVDELGRVVDAGHATAALPIIEDTIAILLRVVNKADDSSGIIGDTVRQLLDVHRWACQAGKPQPTKLARWLLKFNLDEQDWFVADVDGYAEALGTKGLAVFRREVDRRYALGDESFGVRRSRERLAILDRNVDRIVELIGGDLGNWHRYQSLVDAFRQLQMNDEALAWALRGVAEAPLTPQAGQLFEAARDEYLRRGDEVAAVDVMRQRLQRLPAVSSYSALRQLCRRLGTWEDEITSARRALARSPETLLACLLDDGDDESAWELSHTFDASPTLQRRLSKARALTHPADVFEPYAALIDVALAPAGERQYREGISLLRELRTAADAAGRRADFVALVLRLLAEHHRRPTLVAMLQRLL